jgi:hypothetical protein
MHAPGAAKHDRSCEQTDDAIQVRSRTVDLVEFLHDILKVNAFPMAEFPHKVGYQRSNWELMMILELHRHRDCWYRQIKRLCWTYICHAGYRDMSRKC